MDSNNNESEAGSSGLESKKDPPEPRSSSCEADEIILNQLKQCFDPIIPMNIVDLGLVYGINREGERVGITMTLTERDRDSARKMAEKVRRQVLEIEGIEAAKVELVWNPPWHRGMISSKGKRKLGLL
jgi:metal-sulfur cluster biosynthetic enzyme